MCIVSAKNESSGTQGRHKHQWRFWWRYSGQVTTTPIRTKNRFDLDGCVGQTPVNVTWFARSVKQVLFFRSFVRVRMSSSKCFCLVTNAVATTMSMFRTRARSPRLTDFCKLGSSCCIIPLWNCRFRFLIFPPCANQLHAGVLSKLQRWNSDFAQWNNSEAISGSCQRSHLVFNHVCWHSNFATHKKCSSAQKHIFQHPSTSRPTHLEFFLFAWLLRCHFKWWHENKGMLSTLRQSIVTSDVEREVTSNYKVELCTEKLCVECVCTWLLCVCRHPRVHMRVGGFAMRDGKVWDQDKRGNTDFVRVFVQH